MADNNLPKIENSEQAQEFAASVFKDISYKESQTAIAKIDHILNNHPEFKEDFFAYTHPKRDYITDNLMHRAAEAGLDDVVNKLLEIEGVDFDQYGGPRRRSFASTVLQEAFLSDECSPETLKKLLDSGKFDINKVSEEERLQNNSLVSFTAFWGNPLLDSEKSFIEQKIEFIFADKNLKPEGPEIVSALYYAAKGNDIEHFKKFENLLKPTEEQLSQVLILTAENNERSSNINDYLESKLDTSKISNELFYSYLASDKAAEKCEELAQNNIIDLNYNGEMLSRFLRYSYRIQSEYLISLFSDAIENGTINSKTLSLASEEVHYRVGKDSPSPLIEKILARDDFNINTSFNNGRSTLLSEAIEYGNQNTMLMILERKDLDFSNHRYDSIDYSELEEDASLHIQQLVELAREKSDAREKMLDSKIGVLREAVIADNPIPVKEFFKEKENAELIRKDSYGIRDKLIALREKNPELKGELRFSETNKAFVRNLLPDEHKETFLFDHLKDELNENLNPTSIGHLNKRVGKLTNYQTPVSSGVDIEAIMIGRLGFDQDMLVRFLNNAYDGVVEFSKKEDGSLDYKLNDGLISDLNEQNKKTGRDNLDASDQSLASDTKNTVDARVPNNNFTLSTRQTGKVKFITPEASAERA